MQTVEKVVYWIPWIIFEMASYQSVKICTFTLRYSGYLRNVSVPSWGAASELWREDLACPHSDHHPNPYSPHLQSSSRGVVGKGSSS